MTIPMRMLLQYRMSLLLKIRNATPIQKMGVALKKEVLP